MSTVCRSCGAPVRWVVNEKTGSRMPLDPTPLKTEGTRFTMAGWNDPETGAPIVRASVAHETGLASHFSSCPERDAWRR